MLIQKISTLSGKTNSLDLPISEEEIKLWQMGMLIQDAMPKLSADEREFMITGITKEEWDEHFG